LFEECEDNASVVIEYSNDVSNRHVAVEEEVADRESLLGFLIEG
jgi:hypothetical protein